MAIWPKATWAGPPDSNYDGSMVEFRGLVIHIAEGSYDGTIGWQRNPVSDVSSHFVVGLDGAVAQMLDTTVTAWTQAAGNGHWVSVENAGFSTGQLTAAQAETNAELYAWLMATHGMPATLAESPSGMGLGWHGMGGVAWGNHPNCPGPANVALRPSILARAIEISGGGSATSPEDDMAFLIREPKTGSVWVANYVSRRWVSTTEEWNLLRQQGVQDKGDMPDGESIEWYGVRIDQLAVSATLSPDELGKIEAAAHDGAAAGAGGPTASEIAEAVVNEEHSRLES